MAKIRTEKVVLDEVGNWTEIKLEIIRKYAKAYSTILTAQSKSQIEQGKSPFHHVYIDAFAGAGVHVSRDSGELIDGSPSIAVKTVPPFKDYYFIDLDGSRIDHLNELFSDRQDIHVISGDCNEVLMKKVFPNVQYSQYRRGMTILDPYGLDLSWEVIRECGKLRTIDMFLNFPIADINRNVIWHNPVGVDETDIKRMNFFWGDDSWRNVAYTEERTLFGPEPVKQPNEVIAEAFRQRLKDVAGFANVPAPLAMKNSNNAIVYYLYFASQNATGNKIVNEIFASFR